MSQVTPTLAQHLPLKTQRHTSLSKFWLGTWALSGFRYGKTPRQDALAVIEKAIALGINGFDTAPFYGQGVSDALIYPFQVDHDIFITTKIGLRWEGNTVTHAASPEQLKEDVHSILETHNISCIDLLLLHWPDPSIPLQDSVETLLRLSKEGVCRHWGVCNLSAEHLASIPQYSDFVLQQRNSIFHPFVSSEQHQGLKVGYSPYEQGFLLSENKQTTIGKKDIRNRNPYFNSQAHVEWRNTFLKLCAASDIAPGSIALLFPLLQHNVDVCLLGARHMDQLDLLSQTFSFCDDIGFNFSHSDQWTALLSSRLGSSLWEHLHHVPDSLPFN